MAKPIQAALSTTAGAPPAGGTISVDCAPSTLTSAAAAAGGYAAKGMVATATTNMIASNSYARRATIINPTDGDLILVGPDATVTQQSGHWLYPGNSMVISGYIGAFWGLAANHPANLYVLTV